MPGVRLPHLCAGRRPSRAARLSRPPASRERREFLLRRRSPATPTCRSTELLRRPAATLEGGATPATARIPLPRRPLCAVPAELVRAWSSATTPKSTALLGGMASADGEVQAVRRSSAEGSPAGAAAPDRQPDRRHVDRRQRPKPAAAIDAIDGGGCAASTTGPARPAARARRGARPAVRPSRSASATRLLCAPRPRGRQDAQRRHRRGPRGGRFLPLLRGRGAAVLGRDADCPARPARATGLRFAAAASSSASRPGISRWRSSSARSTAALAAGNAVVAKPAEQTPLIAFRAFELLHRGRRAGRARRISCPATARSAPRLSRTRALPASPSPARPKSHGDQPGAGREGRPDRPADRRDRRHQRDDRRRHRAARAGHRRRHVLGVPLRRAALFGAAAPLPSGRCRRHDARDDHRRGGGAELGDPRDLGDRSARSSMPRRRPSSMPMSQWRGPGACASRATSPARARAAPMSRRPSSSSTPLMTDREVFGPILHVVRWKADELDAATRCNRRDRLRPDPRHPHPHRGDGREHHRPASGRQCLCQPQHHRRRRRHPALRRLRPLRHRPQGRRPGLSPRFALEQVVSTNTAAAGGNASLILLAD